MKSFPCDWSQLAERQSKVSSFHIRYSVIDVIGFIDTQGRDCRYQLCSSLPVEYDPQTTQQYLPRPHSPHLCLLFPFRVSILASRPSDVTVKATNLSFRINRSRKMEIRVPDRIPSSSNRRYDTWLQLVKWLSQWQRSHRSLVNSKCRSGASE